MVATKANLRLMCKQSISLQQTRLAIKLIGAQTRCHGAADIFSSSVSHQRCGGHYPLDAKRDIKQANKRFSLQFLDGKQAQKINNGDKTESTSAANTEPA